MRNFSAIAKDIIGNFRKLESYYLIIFAIGKELLKIKTSPNKNYFHLKNALNWLIAQQNYSGGFSAQYSLLYGRGNDFPEITGYIIPTLVDYYKYSKDKRYLENAERAGTFLLSIQNLEGWFPDANVKSKPMVFDTGQIIFGLLSLYQELKEEKFLKAAEKAGEWIINQQEPEGFWKKYAYNDIPHTYYSRVSWALLELWKITKNDIYKKSAIKNLDWVLSQQKENGFFKNCSFFKDETPVLHVISYTTEGLLKSGEILEEEKYILAAKKTAANLLELNQVYTPLFGYYNENWQPKTKSRCLTGLAQISTVFFWIYEMTNDKNYLKEARKINHYLKKKQIISGPKEIRGGISGSSPIWGKYMPLSYPGWSVKFWIDSLLLEQKYKNSSLTLAIFPNDPLASYLEKGETRKDYWNPAGLFSEIHVFDPLEINYSEENREKLQFMAGRAKLLIHPASSSSIKKIKNICPQFIRAYGTFKTGLLASGAGKKYGIPFVVSLHTNYDDYRYRTRQEGNLLKYLKLLAWKYLFEIKIMKAAEKIICVYQFAAKYALENKIPAKKIEVIYNKVYGDQFFIDSKIKKNEKFTIINVGRFIPGKNQRMLIEAIQDLNIKLVLVGQGPERRNLINYTKKLNFQDKIEFMEKIDNKDLNKIYNKCHAYATANLYGGIEIAAIEAMACGLPIIRSKHPAEKEPELLRYEACVFAENNFESFKRGIEKLISDKNYYDIMSKKSLQIYQSIRGEKMEQKEKEVYLNLL